MLKALRETAIWVAAVMLLGGWASPGFAQIKHQFDVSPQPLGKALNAFAAQAGINIYFDPPDVEGLSAKAVKAEMSVDEALRTRVKIT